MSSTTAICSDKSDRAKARNGKRVATVLHFDANSTKGYKLISNFQYLIRTKTINTCRSGADILYGRPPSYTLHCAPNADRWPFTGYSCFGGRLH